MLSTVNAKGCNDDGQSRGHDEELKCTTLSPDLSQMPIGIGTCPDTTGTHVQHTCVGKHARHRKMHAQTNTGMAPNRHIIV